MPEGLAEFFIKFLTSEHDLVLDPFSGSNTTGAVAERLGRRWVGVEARHDYVMDSRVRFPLVCEHGVEDHKDMRDNGLGIAVSAGA
jgi:DNA modification methylase